MTTGTKQQVFLGGSCNPTTWREDSAIPLLKMADVDFYNPQVADWHKGLEVLEAVAKEESAALLFVIDSKTRAIASIQEATEYIAAGRNVALVVEDMVDGTDVDGQVVTGRELKDLNRARAYLRNQVTRYDKIGRAHV